MRNRKTTILLLVKKHGYYKVYFIYFIFYNFKKKTRVIKNSKKKEMPFSYILITKKFNLILTDSIQ
jgi:hypothetical protein